MNSTKIRIWPNGKLVEQMVSEYDVNGNISSMWGTFPPVKIRDYRPATYWDEIVNWEALDDKK